MSLDDVAVVVVERSGGHLNSLLLLLLLVVIGGVGLEAFVDATCQGDAELALIGIVDLH